MLQSSGPISLNNVRIEFDLNGNFYGVPFSLADCYRGAGLVPNHGGTLTIPTGHPVYAKNTISLSDFYGTTVQDPNPGGDGE